ncbi:MAG TPA: 50S ribosomal protein L25 [Saprospiraceae bacterium]|mgnify:CR=1 FL=1|nr:50S ribosomal protein L25 [Saprospiraceae bacterium]MCB9272300.1 50S ribosomal protein L25 [Lewinellaceae bacterium]HPG08091.1 50S ribosomal protein L25 [Saprospiraceae bacterium]HPR00034.1 50S ribosomal protein L25 [Saprospiraceae bacterium]HRV85987.1 50S ribosomal protein L25 [Saprospiraceae bacterium]
MEIVTLKGNVRQEMGTKWAKQVRNEGLIPCVLYGGDTNLCFTVDPHDVKKLVYTSQFKLAEVTVDGSTHRCILKDLQLDRLTDEVIHIDFLKLTPGHKIKINVPLATKGASPGVKLGGKLVTKMRTISVKVSPENLISEVTVDVSGLDLGQTVRVRDIEKVDGVEIMNAPSIPVATVTIPRALRSATSKQD